jgi:transposase
LKLAHDENVADWAAAIAHWLAQQGQSAAPLVQIQQGTGLAIVQVWLAGMLSELKLEQQGEFYEAGGVRVMMNSGHKG